MTDLPPVLDRLLVVIADDVDTLMQDLEAGRVDARGWQERMASTLARGHLAGYTAGSGAALDERDERRILDFLAGQLAYLETFSVEIQDAPEFQKGWNARAAMYASAVGASYYQGRFRMWALPAVPRDGTTACLSRCSCSWDIQELEGEGNADAYWKLGPADHCQQCVERASQWSPLRFRGGELQ